MCILHDCFDFIEEARSNGRRVLVHCSQGVSRSATIVIGYCIWKLNKDYDKVFDYVKKIRTVVSPNMGFQCAPIRDAEQPYLLHCAQTKCFTQEQWTHTRLQLNLTCFVAAPACV